MMSSCVVVGTTCGAVPEMIGDHGLVVPERDAAGLAEGLVAAMQLVADDRLRRSARERAIAVYSGDAVATQLLDLWDSARVRTRVAA